MSWAEQEMQTVDLGDKRLNRRLVSLLDKLGCNASASIPVAYDSWSETKAVYRLFNNPKVTDQKVLQPPDKQPLNGTEKAVHYQSRLA